MVLTRDDPCTHTLTGEKLRIDITIHVTPIAAVALNFNSDALNDILILHTKNGKDHFVSVAGEWQASCFANDVTVLSQLALPVRYVTPEECGKRLAGDMVTQASGPTAADDYEKGAKFSVPKEIWRCVDFIYRYGMDVVCLFFLEKVTLCHS